MIYAPPPPAIGCEHHLVQASVRAPSAAAISWRLDRRFLLARLRPWQGISFLPRIAGPGAHVLTARLFFRDRTPLDVVVLRFRFCE